MTDKTLRIAPHPCGLDWAQGMVHCGNLVTTVRWQADYRAHVFRLQLTLPPEWTPKVCLPDDLCGWETVVEINGNKG